MIDLATKQESEQQPEQNDATTLQEPILVFAAFQCRGLNHQAINLLVEVLAFRNEGLVLLIDADGVRGQFSDSLQFPFQRGQFLSEPIVVFTELVAHGDRLLQPIVQFVVAGLKIVPFTQRLFQPYGSNRFRRDVLCLYPALEPVVEPNKAVTCLRIVLEARECGAALQPTVQNPVFLALTTPKRNVQCIADVHLLGKGWRCRCQGQRDGDQGIRETFQGRTFLKGLTVTRA